MKKAIIMLLLSAIASQIYAQAQKRDTVVLSVYNNNQRFMLYPMPFGKDKPDIDFTATMVVAYDTVNVLKTATEQDTSGAYPQHWATERVCGKPYPNDLKGKVAILYAKRGCDISTQILNAQNAGAMVAIVIHTTDNRDSVTLPRRSDLFPYLDSSRIDIPCFTVRQGIGNKLMTMLPSIVGIQRPTEDVGTIQNRAIQNKPTTTTTATQTKSATTVTGEKPDSSVTPLVITPLPKESGQVSKTAQIEPIGWTLTPNPARDEALLRYNFAEKGLINIEIINELGQQITTYSLPETQIGRLVLDVSSWHEGTYNVLLQSAGVKETKRLIVLH